MSLHQLTAFVNPILEKILEEREFYEPAFWSAAQGQFSCPEHLGVIVRVVWLF